MSKGVAITGATGLIGTTLAAALAREGIPVSALVRDTARGAELLPSATLFAWDASKGPPPEAAFRGVGAVVNLIGESVAGGRWSAARKKRIRDSRVVGTRAVVDVLRGLSDSERPRVLVSASGSAYYGNRGDELLTEASTGGEGFLAELARDWEAEAMKATEIGMRVVVMRHGVVLSKKGGILQKILPPFRLGLGGRIGTGKQWLPWIHIEDQIGLLRHAIATEGVSGALNAVAPEPVTHGEFGRAIGETLGRPTVMKAPVFALRMVLGDMVDEVMLSSQRVMPVRTLETGYAFRHPLLRQAMEDILTRHPPRDAAAPAATHAG
jgi:uncharacterized protein (TIGR01777 family)